MRSIPVSMAAAGFALALASAGAAGAQAYYYGGHPVRYVTTYRPVTRYVTRTVTVRERVWRPVAHRVRYRPVYVHYRPVYVAPYASYAYDGPYFAPAYYGHDWRWEHRRWEHRRWAHERWEYGRD